MSRVHCDPWIVFPKGGFYVEAGAHDGVGDSQTLHLELSKSAKWDGICVEPSSAFRGLQRSRKCITRQVVLGEKDDERIVFREVLGNAIELSGVTDHFKDHWDRSNRPHLDFERIATSLPTLLKAHKAPNVIEYLALDVEGGELPILRGHDFSKHLFLLMQVEWNGVEESKLGLIKLLTPLEYRIVHDDGVNLWFLHESARLPHVPPASS